MSATAMNLQCRFVVAGWYVTKVYLIFSIHFLMQLTVRKEGPNTGRQFYKCSKPQGTGCDFFLWADAAAENAPPAQPAQRRNNPPPANNNNNNRNQQDNDNSITNCNCGEPARAFTVNKEGPNKGRRFYSCQMPQDTKCNFFQWAEDGGGDGI